MSYSSATALAAIGHDGYMTDLSGESILSVNQVSVNNDSTAKSGPEGDHHKIFHANPATIDQFAKCSGIGIAEQAIVYTGIGG
jgi:hypothetical protein